MDVDNNLIEFYSDNDQLFIYMCSFNARFNTYDLLEYYLNGVWHTPDRAITYPRSHFDCYERVDHGIMEQ